MLWFPSFATSLDSADESVVCDANENRSAWNDRSPVQVGQRKAPEPGWILAVLSLEIFVKWLVRSGEHGGSKNGTILEDSE